MVGNPGQSLHRGDRSLDWGLPNDVKCLFCRSIIERRDPCFLNVVLVQGFGEKC